MSTEHFHVHGPHEHEVTKVQGLISAPFPQVLRSMGAGTSSLETSSPGPSSRVEEFACPIAPAPPTACGVVNGDPAAGTAICGGLCPPRSVCAWVPTGFLPGGCQCVDNPCGDVGNSCGGSGPNQNATCQTVPIGSGCGCAD